MIFATYSTKLKKISLPTKLSYIKIHRPITETNESGTHYIINPGLCYI